MQDQRFYRFERLKLRRNFQAVFDAKQSAGGAILVVYGRPNELPFNRIGISIGRRFGNAVQRNRFKRVCREAFRLSKSRQPVGWDWIVLPKGKKGKGEKRSSGPAPSSLRLEDIQTDLLSLMRRIAKKAQRKDADERPHG